MRWLILAAVTVVGLLVLAVGYVDVYARPIYIDMDGRHLICWPKEMRHVWERGGRHIFACVPIERELWMRK